MTQKAKFSEAAPFVALQDSGQTISFLLGFRFLTIYLFLAWLYSAAGLAREAAQKNTAERSEATIDFEIFRRNND